MLGSLVVFVRVNHALYGGPTPYAADVPGETATDAEFPMRLPRPPAAAGRPVAGPRLRAAALGAACSRSRSSAAWLLWRSRRERVAAAVPQRREVEVAAALLLAVCAGAGRWWRRFGAPTMFGFWFPGRHLVAALPAAAALAAWGLRHAPRAGAVLGALTLVASVWLLVELWTGAVDGWVAPRSSAPWGPLEAVFPLYGTGSVWAAVVGGVAVAALLALGRARVAARRASWRQTAGHDAAGVLAVAHERRAGARGGGSRSAPRAGRSPSGAGRA